VPRAVPGRVRLTGRSPLDGGWLGAFLRSRGRCERLGAPSVAASPGSPRRRSRADRSGCVALARTRMWVRLVGSWCRGLRSEESEFVRLGYVGMLRSVTPV
jgi:hypothetical protein